MTPNKLPPLPEKFRKRPVVIEASQLSRENGPDLAAMCGGQWLSLYGRGDRGEDISHVVIPTLEGKMRADLGDWIIKGVQGEFYPCKPDIFAATYEPAEALRQSQSLPAGAVAGLVGKWRENADALRSNQPVSDWQRAEELENAADELEQSLQADAREKGEALEEVETVIARLYAAARHVDRARLKLPDSFNHQEHKDILDAIALIRRLATQPAQASEKDGECQHCGLRDVRVDDLEAAIETLSNYNPGPDEFANALDVLRNGMRLAPTHPQPVTPAGGEVATAYVTPAGLDHLRRHDLNEVTARAWSCGDHTVPLFLHPPVADAALAKCEPVAWQFRTSYGRSGKWSQWEPCTENLHDEIAEFGVNRRRKAEARSLCVHHDSALQSKYDELIYAVASKYPEESRHHTALRYIRDRESNFAMSEQAQQNAALNQRGGR